MGHTLQHLNEFVYPARARSSRLVLSFPRGDDILVIWLLSDSNDNIEIKSKLCFSNLELSKRFPSSKPLVAVCNENMRVTEMDVGPIKSFHERFYNFSPCRSNKY